jgi:hypothetical protein
MRIVYSRDLKYEEWTLSAFTIQMQMWNWSVLTYNALHKYRIFRDTQVRRVKHFKLERAENYMENSLCAASDSLKPFVSPGRL